MRTIRPDVRRLLRPFCLLALAVSPLVGSVASAATVCATPGKDGVGSGLSGIINTYYAGSGTASGTSITLGARNANGASTGLSSGDLILIIQMQDGSGADFATNTQNSTYGTLSSGNKVGQYEYATVQSVSGTAVTLASNLINSYVEDTTNGRSFQVVRVPQYSSATISGVLQAAPWTTQNSAPSGGIVAMDVAGQTSLNANIDVSGQGFRGGAGINGKGNRDGGVFSDQRYSYQSPVNGASKGEGTAGTPRFVFDGTATPFDGVTEGYLNGSFGQGAPGNAGGGGNDGTPSTGNNQYNSGGGGGANAGAGGQGGYNWAGSKTLGSTGSDAGGRGGRVITPSITKLFMGGGGGAGSSNNNDGTNAVANGLPSGGPVTSSGASGGGMVFVRTGSLVVGGGQINANGSNGVSVSGTNSSEASGGGGAGGSVLLNVNSGSTSVTINAQGGSGGNSNYVNHGPGGGGGGGSIITSSTVAGTRNISGGAHGLDSSSQTYGSVNGSDGLNTTFSAQPGTGAASSANCAPVLTVSKSTSTPAITRSSASDSSTASYTIVVQNGNAAGGAVGVNITDPLPSPFTYTAAAVMPTYSGGASGPSNVTGSGAVSGGLTTVTFGTAGGTSANSFYIPQGGSVSLTFSANLATASSGTYQNPASVNFSDPTRTVSTTIVSPGGTYAAGGTVGGINYDSASSTAEDVKVGVSYNIACPTVLAVANVKPATGAATGTLFQLNSDGSMSAPLANLSATSYALGRDPLNSLVYYFNNTSTSTATLYYYNLMTASGGTAATVSGTGGGSGVTTIFTRFGFRQDGTGYAMLGNGTLYKVAPGSDGTTATVTSVGVIQDQDGNALSTLGGGDFAFDKYDNAWAIFTDLDSNSATYNQSVLYKIDLSKLTGGNLKVATRIGAVTLGGAKASLSINGLAFNTDNNSFLTDNSGNTYSDNIGQNDASNQNSVTGTVAGSATVPYDLASCFYPDTKPAITVSKSVASSATPVVQGTQLTYTLTVHNGGNAPATGVSLKDAVPANTTYVANSTTLNGTAVTDSGTPITMPYANGGVIRSPDAASGAPTASGALTTVGTGTARDAVVTFKVTVNSSLSNSASPITNTATATYDNPQSGGAALTQTSNQTQTPVILPPNIVLTKLVRNIGTVLNPTTQASTAFGTSASGRPGDYLEYCVSYNNTGSGSATSLTINDSVAASGPANLNGYGTGNGILFANGVVLASGATAAPAGVTRTSAADADAGTLTATSFSYAVGALASGGQGTVCFKAQVP